MNVLPVNTLRPGEAYMHQLNGSSLDQVMACRLQGAKPLPEPMMYMFVSDSLPLHTIRTSTNFTSLKKS